MAVWAQKLSCIWGIRPQRLRLYILLRELGTGDAALGALLRRNVALMNVVANRAKPLFYSSNLFYFCSVTITVFCIIWNFCPALVTKYFYLPPDSY